MFFVFVYPNAPRSIMEHEFWHVWQNWVSLFIGSALFNKTKKGEFLLESAAFGRELKFVDDDHAMAKTYAKFLVGPTYSHGRNYEECLIQIKKKYKKGWLI